MSLLVVRELTVCYGAVAALEKASLEINQGEIVAMIGPNGAGKSTCLRALAGILPYYDGHIKTGEINFECVRINNMPPHKLIRLGLSLVPENRHVFQSMSVEENFKMGGHTIKRGQKSIIKERVEQIYEIFPRLKERRKQMAGTLSTGEQQMLAMGRGLMIKPKLMLVDEPTVGLSPNLLDLVFDVLVEISKAGTSILLVEQNARYALDVCHRAYVFEIGKIVLNGKREELLEDVRVKKAYLGDA